ncbi:hypothetical protein DL98DRAFT_517423 [Cadophora sp. DSE1049]|nr:hypothetical protein DL98DRAFT_517423 [Cadophora sp. DSE1049]
MNRRAWWSIHVLDSWGATTLGRPFASDENRVEVPGNMVDDGVSLKILRTSHGLTTTLARTSSINPADDNFTSDPQYRILQNRVGCPTSTANVFLTFKEISILDQTLVSWYEALPPFMKSPNSCPPELHDVRNILKWRYLNMRMISHRAVVLDTTGRQLPFNNLGSEEQDVVRQCRNIAAESIFAIQVEWRPNKMCGWNAVWFLFQACLVPLMALAVESEQHEEYMKWQEQVVLVIELCDMMNRWSLVG